MIEPNTEGKYKIIPEQGIRVPIMKGQLIWFL
jgi:hypothetical protein